MPAGDAVDIVLFGYRNDVARVRVLSFLEELPRSVSGPFRVEADATVPQRVFTTLSRPDAETIRLQLEALGAQVALVAAGAPPGPGEPPTANHGLRFPINVRPRSLIIAAALGVALYLWRQSPHAVTGELWAPHGAPQLESLYGPSAVSDEPAAAAFNAQAIGLANAGQFEDAVDRLQMALRAVPDHPVLRRNLQTVLLEWADAELKDGKLEDADRHLNQAAQLGDRAEVLYALGVTYLREAKYPQAALILEHTLQLSPKNTPAMIALADVYLKQDRRADALELLQRAKEAGASGPELDERLQRLSREVDAEWDFAQRQSAHFRISFADDEDHAIVEFMLAAFEDAYYSVGAKFDYYPDGRAPVVLYTQQDFRALTQAPDWAGGVFDGWIKMPVRGVSRENPDLARLVRHEYAHSLIARLGGAQCPVWLNEGLAVWAEEERDGDHESWAYDKSAGQELFAFGELNRSFTGLPANRVEIAYAESYLAVHTLVDQYGARTVPALLDALKRTGNMGEAFAAVYRDDLGRFEEALLSRLRS